MPFTGALIISLLALYMLVLFAVAWRADRKTVIAETPHKRAIIYALSITVYFTSWTYYGAVGTAARSGWQYLPIFLGPILAITVCFPLWRKIAHAVKRENVGSIADFLASRYGKNRMLGTIVALVTIVGTMPYIALQLKSLSMTWGMVTGNNESSGFAVPVIAATLAGFAILFGARRPTLTEHSRGLVRAIALESVVKLTALMSVAGLALFAIWAHGAGKGSAPLGLLSAPPVMNPDFFSATFLAFAAIFCLPRQFHVGFVELENVEDVRTARWLMPFYLTLTSVTVIPILAAGSLISHGAYSNPDLYVLEIPIRLGGPLLTALAFLGGFSAATAMVTVETVALSAMVSNELVLPFLARTRWKIDRERDVGRLIVNIRRGSILVIIFFGWLYFHSMNQSEALGQIGLTSFAAVAQLLPSLIGAVFWRRGHAQGAIWGISSGIVIWACAIAAPQFLPHVLVANLQAQGASAGISSNNFFVTAIFCSLALNTALYIGGSLRARPRLIDRIQSAAFIEAGDTAREAGQDRNLHGNVGDLKAMLSQFLGQKDGVRAFERLGQERGGRLRDGDQIDPSLARATERLLAGAIGASLARSVIGWQLSDDRKQAVEVVRVLDEAAEAVQFNRELLQTSLDNLDQGVSVVDADLRLVAWNKRYLNLFNFPPGFIHVGRPVSEVIEYAAKRSGHGGPDLEQYMEDRMGPMRRRVSQVFERARSDGIILKVSGSPIPGGRYLTSFTDVTELRGAATALREANDKLERSNEQLEERVRDRTTELTQSNNALADAKIVAERATKSQTRFLAAASHDVLQPLQAARLLIGTVVEDVLPEDQSAVELLSHADLSIETADKLLRALLNLSRLEVGGLKPDVQAINAGALLEELQREFQLVASEKGLDLRAGPTSAWVLSDPDLLRSILQNLISNAVKYTREGGIIVGCRRDAQGVRFEVRDSGPGIPEDEIQTIFKEYFRLQNGIEAGPGAGLGLSIAERICNLLGHKLAVRSEVGKGSVFSVIVPRADIELALARVAMPGVLPKGFRILYVENDPNVLQSMRALLCRWGADVSVATGMNQALNMKGPWDVILADYHLEADGTGLDLLTAMRGRSQVFALITAAPSDGMLADASKRNIDVIRKPVAPSFLRAFLIKSLHQKAAE